MTTEIVYLGHDNSIDLILKADGTAVDLSSVTQMTVTLGGTTITSAGGDTDPIRWAKSGYDTGEVRLYLGGQTIPAGSYRAVLVVYDSVNLNGIVWGERIPIAVEEEVEAP